MFLVLAFLILRKWCSQKSSTCILLKWWFLVKDWSQPLPSKEGEQYWLSRKTVCHALGVGCFRFAAIYFCLGHLRLANTSRNWAQVRSLLALRQSFVASNYPRACRARPSATVSRPIDVMYISIIWYDLLDIHSTYITGHWNLIRPGYSNPFPVTPTSRLPVYWPDIWPNIDSI